MKKIDSNSYIGHKYKFKSEMKLSDLKNYKEHRRLGIFFHKGTTCVTCGVVGTRLIKAVDPSGGVHVDVYTDDLKLMTVDHITPRSLGGDDTLENKQPMCTHCNSRKGNGQQRVKQKRDPSIARAKKFRKKVNRAVKGGFTFSIPSVNINVLKVVKF